MKTEKQEQLVIVLGLIRDRTGRVLLARRVDETIPDALDKWELVGGKVDFGEEPEEALLREVREESGLTVSIVRLLPKVCTHIWKKQDGSSVQVFLLTYECLAKDTKTSNGTVADEIGELRFVTLQELLALDVLPNVREVIPFL